VVLGVVRLEAMRALLKGIWTCYLLTGAHALRMNQKARTGDVLKGGER